MCIYMYIYVYMYVYMCVYIYDVMSSKYQLSLTVLLCHLGSLLIFYIED